MTPEARVVLNLALCVGVVAVLWTLSVLLCRERVERALAAAGLRAMALPFPGGRPE